MLEENLMHCNDVHETLYQICEIYGPFVSGIIVMLAIYNNPIAYNYTFFFLE